ncbi:hypothetical protein VTN02DRAFT_366 [Thermoascus thermophilus]
MSQTVWPSEDDGWYARSRARLLELLPPDSAKDHRGGSEAPATWPQKRASPKSLGDQDQDQDQDPHASLDLVGVATASHHVTRAMPGRASPPQGDETAKRARSRGFAPPKSVWITRSFSCCSSPLRFPWLVLVRGRVFAPSVADSSRRAPPVRLKGPRFRYPKVSPTAPFAHSLLQPPPPR